MSRTPFWFRPEKAFFAVTLSFALVLVACDEKNSSRQHGPARRNGTMKPNGQTGTPIATNLPKGGIGNQAQKPGQGNPNGFPQAPGLPSSPNGTSPVSPEDNSDEETPDNTTTAGSGRTASPSSLPRGKGLSPNTPSSGLQPRATPTYTAPQSPADPVLGNLQQVLSQLSNIYLNAWYSVNKDRSSRPRNFFEDVAAKLQNLGPILTLKPGETTPASLLSSCDRYRMVQSIDTQKNRRRLLLFDCATRSYVSSPILSFNNNGHQWQLATTPQALDFILPNQLGYLSTISFKPICLVTTEETSGSVKITKAVCKEWGQQLSAAKAKDRKTVLLTSIIYNPASSNVLETEAQYVDYDGNNQLCRSGIMKRKAPNSTDVIYLDDDGDQECRPSPLDPASPLGIPQLSPAPSPAIRVRPPVAPSIQDDFRTNPEAKNYLPRFQAVPPPIIDTPVNEPQEQNSDGSETLTDEGTLREESGEYL